MGKYRSPLNLGTLEAFLAGVRASRFSTVDLSPFDFIDVYASVVLALTVRHACIRNHEPPDLLLPQNEDVRAYLARQDFFKQIGRWYEVDDEIKLLESRQWAGNPRVAPLTVIESEDDVSGIVNRIRKLLRSQQFGVPKTIADAVWRVLSETLQNIPQHASGDRDSPECGFAALQLYRGAVDIAVGDVGIGLRQSLAQNPRYLRCSDRLAQKAILVDGASRISVRGRGNGLQLTGQTIAKLSGTLRVQSGDTVTYYSGRNYRQVSCPVFPGTQVLIRIPCRS
jgi:hypothetical protein